MKTNIIRERIKEGDLLKVDSKPCRIVQTAFGLMAVPATAEMEGAETACLHDLPLIPLDLFYSILNWQRKIVEKHDCECHTSLFLINGEWVAEPFYQENTHGSMTIDVDYESTKNGPILAALKENAQRGVHATIHNHVNSPAGQSSVDVSDEEKLCGPHITLGNMKKEQIDFHGRFSLLAENEHRFIPMRVADIIELPLPPSATAEQIKLAEKLVLNNVPIVDYPEEWEDRFNVERTVKKVEFTKKTTAGHQQHAPTAMGSKTATGCSGKTVFTFEDIGSEPIDETTIRIDMAPWSVLMTINTENWIAFKTDCWNRAEELQKPLMSTMMHHGTDLYTIFETCSKLKTEEQIKTA